MMSNPPSSPPAKTADDVPSIDEVEILGQSDVAGQTTDAGKGRIFPCEGCGADLHFDIGEQRLKCPFCGFEKQIELGPDAEIREQDLLAMLDREKTRHTA